MTCFEKYKRDFPEEALLEDGCPSTCPHNHGYNSAYHMNHHCCNSSDECRKCWAAEDLNDRTNTGEEEVYELESGKTIPVEKCHVSLNNEPSIKDSGDRTEFESGAVRDMREGKGRFDIAPLEVISKMIDPDGDTILDCIADFMRKRDTKHLYDALNTFTAAYHNQMETLLLETAIHFEEGAKKYGEANYRKGIPVWCYIDSAVRHYIKWLRGDKEEPHHRAFCWNLMCCIWEVDHGEQWRSHIKT